MYKLHNSCRACGYGPPANAHYFKSGDANEKLEKVLDLGPMPLANSFTRGPELRPGLYPLELMVCPRCTLGQLSAVVDPSVLYSNYLYVTSPSQTLKDHSVVLYDWLKHLSDFRSVVEIGSNDGQFLKLFQGLGAGVVVGIDPAQNLAKSANDSGVQTIARPFDIFAANSVACILAGGADLILARHVFCHIDDWRGFLKNAAMMSHQNTLLCIEAPWAHDTIQNVEWDQIYHEHLSYLTLRSLESVVAGTSWKLYAVRQFSIHGGTLAVVLRRRDHPEGPLECIEDFMSREKCTSDDWKQFAKNAIDQQLALNALLVRLKAEGKKVAGYGAPAKASTWTAALRLTRSKVYAFYDCTPLKHYTTVPGSDIPVVPEGGFYVDNPDYAILWAWNFADEIIRKNSKWCAGGGKFIIPVPKVEIV